MRQAAGDFGAVTRSAGPNSHSFFVSARVRSSEKRLLNPYRQHAYFHAAVKHVALAISSVPFRIFVENGAAEQLSFRHRKQAYQELRKTFPALKMDLFDLFHDKGENVRKKLRREFAKAIQKIAPGVPLATVAKAVDLDIVDHGAWFDLFANVNPLMTRSQLWEALVIYMQTDGECFWIPLDESGEFWEPPGEPVPGPKQEALVPSEIFVFGKKGFKPKVDSETKMLDGWEWRDPRRNMMSFTAGKPIILKPEQVIHFRFFDPDDFFGGLSPFQALDIELRQDHNASRYNAAFFEKGAQLSGWLSFEEGITSSQRQDLQEQFSRDHQGIDNAWQPGMLEGRAKWNQSGITQRDMQFFTLREWVRDEILAVIGTPKSEMGIFQDVNRASAQVSRRVFWENTNVPIMNYIEDLLFSDFFQPVNGGSVFGMFDLTQVEALREDLSDKAKVAETLFRIGVPLNDIVERLELGFERYAWGDVAWISQNLNPIGSDPTLEPPPQETPPPDDTPPPPPGDDGDEGEDGTETPPPEPEDEESDGGAEESKPAMRPPPGLGFVGEYSRAQKEERWREIITRVMDPGEKKIKKTVRALTVRMRAASLAAIGDAATEDGSMRNVMSVDEILFTPDPFRLQLHEAIKPIYAEIFEAAAEEAEEELVEVGIVPLKDFNPVRLRQTIGEFDLVAEQLVETQAERIEAIVDTVRGLLSESLDHAMRNGHDEEQMKKAVRSRFKVFSGSFWLNRTARTESSLSTNSARDLIFRRRQVPSNVWLNVGDDRVRDTHVTLDDGIPRAIGFNFGRLIGGGIVLQFPLDPRAPAEETILCRCVLLPSQSPPVESPDLTGSPSPLGRDPFGFVDTAKMHANLMRASAAQNHEAGTSTFRNDINLAIARLENEGFTEEQIARFKELMKLEEFLQGRDIDEIANLVRDNPNMTLDDFTLATQFMGRSPIRRWMKDRIASDLGQRMRDKGVDDEEWREFFSTQFGGVAKFEMSTEEGFGFPLDRLDLVALPSVIRGPRLASSSDRKIVDESEYLSYRSANFLVGQWADTAADSDVEALAIQLEIQDFLFRNNISGVDPSKIKTEHFERKSAASLAKAREFQAAHKNVLRAFVESVYESTQEDFKKRGITEVPLFRGQSLRGNTLRAEETSAVLGLQPGSSFTIDPTTGNGFSPVSINGILLSSMVPAERIWSCSRTGPGCFMEGEFIVFGGELDASALNKWKATEKAKEEGGELF